MRTRGMVQGWLLAAMAVGLMAQGCSGGTAREPQQVVLVDLTPQRGALGAACVVPDDCASGFCDRTVPGGYCSQECTVDADCPNDGICGEGMCLQRCLSQRECRSEEFNCYASAVPDVGVCGFNLDAVRPTSPNIGAPCRATIECLAGEGLMAACIPEIGLTGQPTGWPGGICVASGCGAGVMCDAGSVCLVGPPALCLQGCGTDADCREGYGCDPDAGACVALQ